MTKFKNRAARGKKLKPTGRRLSERRKVRRQQYIRDHLWLGTGLGVLALLGAGWVALEQSLPDTSNLATVTSVRSGTITLKSSDGFILQQSGPASREQLKIQQVPDQLAEAFIAIEDRRFHRHSGIDLQGILRALSNNILSGEVVEGGSTITQQLARTTFLDQELSALRKLREARLAQKIEAKLSKDQILERYLNLVYLGAGAYGVADAAWVYFSKPVTALTLSEMATLAGLPAAPSVYSPITDPEAARQRRNLVLEQMQTAGFITATEAAAASATPVSVKRSLPKHLQDETPYFTSFIQEQLPKVVPAETLKQGGVSVETTLNLEWQQAAESAVEEAILNNGPAQGFEQAALVAIDPRNGEVKAMVGGPSYEKSQFNRATQAKRQPGSTFKAIVYTTAIAAGLSPHDGYLDAPYVVDGYEPKNSGKTHRGWVSMGNALTRSINVVAVKVLIDVGFEPVIRLANQMGIESKLQPIYSLALGSTEVTPLELTSAYGTLAAQGRHTQPHGIRRVINRQGEVIYDADFKPKRVIDPGTTAIVTSMLENVVLSGTGTPAQLGRPVAGKTGTSEQARDLWFVGYIPQMVAGVWLGNDNNYPTGGSSATAAYTWHEFMSEVVEEMPVGKFPQVPTLDGRKGSIKAEPVRPKNAYTGTLEPPPEESSGNGSYYNGDASQAENSENN